MASGGEAWVTSSSDEKIARAVKLGARGGFRYDSDGWVVAASKEAGPFDVIIDSAGGAAFGNLLELASPGGRIAFFGATRGSVPELALRRVFWKQISLLGSTIGSPADWSSMMAFMEGRRLAPVVGDVFPLERGAEAFDLMERGGQFGKIVIRI
jgi:NADPH:quinone reductase-like Zn-dependent oxidoreductase